MVQEPVRELCEIGAKLTDGLSAEQLKAAEKYVDELTQPLGQDDIEALFSCYRKTATLLSALIGRFCMDRGVA
jgi:hypothetical protein